MGIKYTKEQQEVIELRNRNLLVCAAAGSGKTAVLVERICQLILDETNPFDVDELLVVTFTNAAAAEMKKRIMLSLQKRLEEHPTNKHLQKQITLIHNANISTIDGFCLRLLKEYFYLLDLEPGFRIADENERALILEDVMNQVIDSYYEEGRKDFLDFVESYEEGKTDDGLKAYIEKMYKTASASPWPKKWLDSCRGIYDAATIKKPEDIMFVREALKDARLRLKDCVRMLLFASNECSAYEALDKLSVDLYDRADEIKQILECNTYEKCYHAICNYTFKTMPRIIKLDAVTQEVKDTCKAIRDKVKKEVESIKNSCFMADATQIVKDHLQMSGKVNLLCDMTSTFMEAFSIEKKRRNVVDFSDVEHMALSLLYNEDGSFSKVALECRRQFKEIMIDEYQDSNQLQEAILTAISRNPEGGHNLFMVGDVKQSIYRFRQAEPKLFLNKYHTYTETESSCQKVILDANFRSRKEVLRFSNLIFEGLMKEDLGGIDYDEQASLKYAASFDEGFEEAFFTKVLVADEDSLKASDKGSKEEHEGHMIGLEIQKLMEDGVVWDTKQNKYRRPYYSDIVILMRSKKMSATIAKELEMLGIPAIAIEKTGYFKTTEVTVILSMLRVIDNERQDIPLAAVLLSPIGGLNKKQLATIKAAYAELSFYEAVRLYAKEGAEEEIKKKLHRFYELLSDLKKKTVYLSVHTLIKELYKKSGYYEYVQVMVDGEVRKQNLDILIERAKDYEKTSYHGLFQFLRYIDKMQKYDLDFSEGNGQQTLNAVHLMTIHKSKGLEFPIVFVAGLGKKFNLADTKETLITDADYKVALKYTDPVRRIKADSVSHEAMKNLMKRDNLAEEIRVLYVALTRAKEKLILSGSVKDYEKLCQEAERYVDENGKLSYSAKMGTSTYYQWILPILLTNMAHTKANFTIEVMTNFVDKTVEEEHVLIDTQRLLDVFDKPYHTKDGQQHLKELFETKYHHHNELTMKEKMSVSEIKHRFMEYEFNKGEDEEKPDFLKEEYEETIPFFMGEEDRVNRGALKGTATHRILECLDFTQEGLTNLSYEYLEEEIGKLFAKGLISAEQKDMVSRKGIYAFLVSEVGQEVLKAARKGVLVKEQPFVMGITPKEAGLTFESEDRILVQGIIDVFYETEEGIVLLDYKTDRVQTAEELVKRYSKQMELYRLAIERVYEKPVSHVYLYSFSLKEVIDVH